MASTHQTYSFEEIIERLPSLDTASLSVLKSIIEEEAETYTLIERIYIAKYVTLFFNIATKEERIEVEIKLLQAALAHGWRFKMP